MTPGHDPLLEPYRLRHLHLRNRIMSTAHEPAYAEDGLPKDRYRLYHVEKAKGGIALTMTAGSAVVSPDSPATFGNLLAYRDDIVGWMKRLADECHEAGAAVMIQLTHLGRRTNYATADWLPVLSASPIREPAHRSFPKEAEIWDIERIIADYAAAAERMRAAGLDGIEIEAYGHLPDSFLSPATNRRTDEYGGSLENRLRFFFHLLDAVREAVGAEFIVGTRLVADEDWERGLSKEEGLEICRRIAASGKIDFLNIIRGHIDTDAALTKVIPIAGMASAPHLDFAGEVRTETKFPVFHAGRIADIATARHAVASGKLDMVGMTRAHLADPHIVRKIMAGREHEIRPCVGATYCLDRIYEGRDALCIHNAATGREATMPHEIARASVKKRVVVVGAGPAGLEAARVAGERGHEVVVLEATEKPGGQILLAVRSPRRRELIGIVEWRIMRLLALGARIRFGVFAAAGDVLGEEPDVVFVATGGLPDTAVLEEGNDLVTSSWDILSGQAKVLEHVLLFDDHASHQGLQAGEMIAETGAKLEIVTPERFFAVEMGGMNHHLYARAFHRLGVRITINTRLKSLTREGNRLRVLLGSDHGPEIYERVVDQVVIEHGTLPDLTLYEALKPHSVNFGEVDYRALLAGEPQKISRNGAGRFRLFRIGDAIASRNIHAAIFDALRLAKDL